MSKIFAVDAMIRTYSETKHKAVSVLYQSLRDSEATYTQYIKGKWERERNINITQKEWQDILQIQAYEGDLNGKT